MICAIPHCNVTLVGKQTKYCSRKCRNISTNLRHNNYQSQQQRGISRKLHFILAMGGKCSKCGYKKNLAALTFHHTDPSMKEMRLDRRIMSNHTMKRLRLEVAKCILLCSNCHIETHNPNGEEWWTLLDSNQALQIICMSLDQLS